MEDHEVIGRRVAEFAERIIDFRSRVRGIGPQDFYGELLEELQSAVQSLQISSEELRAQNEELTEARVTLEQETRRYQELFDFAPDAYLVTDADGIIQEANRAAFELFNSDQAYLIGKPIQRFATEAGRRALRLRIFRMCYLPRAEQWQLMMAPRQQEPILVQIRAASVRNRSDGHATSLRWMIRRVVEQESTAVVQPDQKAAAVLELRKSYATLKEALNTVADPVLVVDREWNITYINRPMEKLLGATELDVIAQNLWEVMPDAIGSRFYDKLTTAMAAGQTTHFREVYIPARRSFEITAQAGEFGLAVLLKDVEEDALPTSRDTIDLERFAAGTAHYFRSYLGVIETACNELLRSDGQVDPNLDAIDHAVGICQMMTERLLAFTRQQVYLAVPTDLVELMSELEARLGEVAAPCALHIHLERDLPQIEIDPDRIRDVLVELTTNARNALENKPGMIELKLSAQRWSEDEQAQGYVRIDVRDTGIGMDDYTIEHAFEPFFTTRDRLTVPGLGLPMVLGILRRAGGTLRLRSQPGAGTLARVMLPIRCNR